MQAAFAELRQQLAGDGPLAEASYVIVRELPAGDWGYGGRTQQARKAALAA
ncbi:tautomerase family protein [Acidovorax sp. M2(2025)]|uniref:tautomerase family protein n=1 Tax=Acidovorax sp. M2(2025) TaxID=3411355 RepID=UPI003BF59549